MSERDKRRQLHRKQRDRVRDQDMLKHLNPAKRCQLATANVKIKYMLGYMLDQPFRRWSELAVCRRDSVGRQSVSES